MILDGKSLADQICHELKERADALKAKGIQPELTIVTSGADDASKVYVRNKIRRCTEIGIHPIVQHFDYLTKELAMSVRSDLRPTMFQMPITGSVTPAHLSQCFHDGIYDVDGFICDNNVSALASGNTPLQLPCTPKGVIRLLDEYNIPIDGRKVCIIGRSNIVGRPMSRMFEQRNATVILCHSHTTEQQLADAVAHAGIVVSAVGRKGVIDHHFISKYQIPLTNTVLIDVGINRDESGKLCGDIDPLVLPLSSAYTPVPGGIGPMTVAMLMENTIECYERAGK